MQAVGAQSTARNIDTVNKSVTDVEKGAGKASARLGAMRKGLHSFGQRMTATGRAMTRSVTVPVLAFGAAAVKSALDFDTAMSHITTLVGLPRREVRKLGNEVLNLSKATGAGPKDLAEGLYFLTSSGLNAREAMVALRVSAKASAAGLGDTKTVADAVSSAMNAYGHKTMSAKRATDVLVAATKAGKGEPAEFAAAIGHVLPMASQLGVKFEEIGGSTAALTLTGNSAAEAVTSVRQTLQKMIRPTTKGRKLLDQYAGGLGNVQDFLKKKGFLATLEMLKQKFHGNTQQLSTLFNGVEGFNGVLALTGKHSKDAHNAMRIVGAASGSLDTAFKSASHTAKFQLNKALANAKVALILIGRAILPVLIPIVKKLAEWVGKLAGWFSHLPKPVKTVIIVALLLLAALGPLAVGIGAVSLAIDVLLSPVALIVIGVGALIAILILAYKHFSWFRKIVAAVWWIMKNSPLGLVIRLLIWLVKKVWSARHTVAKAFSGFWNGLKHGAVSVINWVIDRINNLIDVANALPFIDIGKIGHVTITVKNQGGPPAGFFHNREGGPTGPPSSSRGAARASWKGHGLARGGVVDRGGVFTVGERGSETVALPDGTAVRPHMSAQELVAYLTVNLDGRALAKGVHRAAVRARSTG